MKKTSLVLTLLSSLLIVGCNSKEEVSATKKQVSTLTVAQGSKPKSLDPNMNNEIPALFISKQIFNTLVAKDDEGNIVPELAESYNYESPTSILFNLRKDVKFHNGEPFTASDVIFSINRMKSKPGSKVMIEELENVEKIDEYTVRIILRQPSAPFLFNLTYPLTAILNEKDTNEKNDNVSTSPVGTGPFKFVSWGDGEKIELENYEGYYRGKPRLDKLVIKSIPENSSRLAALETGEVDMATGIAPIDKETITKNEKLQLISNPTTSTEFISLNNRKELLSHMEVRQALQYAIDKKSIVDAIYLGAAEPANTMVNPNVFGHYAEVNKTSTYNPEKARELLKNLGKENMSLKLWTNDNPVRIQVAQIIQANMKEVGINVEIEILEWGAYLQRSANGEHDMLLGGWVSGTSDTDIVVYPLFHSHSTGAGGNRAFYSNPKMDELILKGRTAEDSDQRKQAYQEAQLLLAEEVPMIPLLYKNENLGISKKVKNFKFAPTTIHELYSVEKE